MCDEQIGPGREGTSEKTVNTVFGYLVTNAIENEKVFQDVAFGASKRVNIPSSGTVDIVFDPTSVATDFLVLLPISIRAFGAGPVNVDLYFGGTYGDDGTDVICFNRDNTSSTDCQAEIQVDPTITTTGVKLAPEFVIFSNGTPATVALGGEVRQDFVTNLRKDGKYLIRLTNQESNPAQGWFGLNWFEVNAL